MYSFLTMKNTNPQFRYSLFQSWREDKQNDRRVHWHVKGPLFRFPRITYSSNSQSKMFFLSSILYRHQASFQTKMNRKYVKWTRCIDWIVYNIYIYIWIAVKQTKQVNENQSSDRYRKIYVVNGVSVRSRSKTKFIAKKRKRQVENIVVVPPEVHLTCAKW